MRKSNKKNRQVKKVNNQPQPIKQMEKVVNDVKASEVPSSEFEKPTTMVEEQPQAPMRISELHLAKIHEVRNKGLQIKDIAHDIFQKEFALKEAKKQLDNLNKEYLKEDNKISNEIAQVYEGFDPNTFNIQTGEYTVRQN